MKDGMRRYSALTPTPSRSVLLVATLLLAAFMPTSKAQTSGFGAPVRPVEVKALPLTDAPMPRSTDKDLEVIFVSGYEPVAVGARVYLDRPGKAVVLMLASYAKTLWQIEVLSGTSLVAVSVGSNDPGTTVTANVPTQGYRLRIPYATEIDNANFRTALRVIGDAIGADHIDAFRGSYRIAREQMISERDPPREELTTAGPAPRAPPISLQFELLDERLEPVRWTLLGPPDRQWRSYLGRAVAMTRAGVVYGLTRERLEVRPSPNHATATPIELSGNFPAFSWPTGIAYDSDREIVAVVTLGGEGFLYRYDVKARKWLDYRSLHDVDITGFAYDPVAKRYVAWTTAGDLIFISPQGERQFSRKAFARLTAFGETYDRGNERVPPLMIVPRGNDIALIHFAGGQVHRVWLYRVSEDTATMTYRAGS